MKTNSDLTIAMAGNPNSGKTTIFNAITKGNQRVGNYPGVTVEKVEGYFSAGGTRVRVVDLPGTYSLTAYSVEELVARNFIIEEKPDLVVNVVDTSNLEPNLYLTTQLMELGVPMVLVFNMSDLAKQKGLEFDLDKMSELMGIEIVQTIGNKRKGIEDLMAAILTASDTASLPRGSDIHYGNEVEESLERIAGMLEQKTGLGAIQTQRWTALKLLESDKEVCERIEDGELHQLIEAERERIKHIYHENPETVIADHRYGYIAGAYQESVRSTVEMRKTMSDRIDSLLLHRVLGMPIFLLMMYLVFFITFTVASPLMGGLEHVFDWLGNQVSSLWPEGSDSLLKALLVEGVIGGVGGVLVFVPNIMLLFLGISILEDTGYMARAAFIMDKLMHKIGLHGKSFIPMLLGFGCSVPAILATRTLENRRNRLTTMLVIPLISCSARLPIYALIIPAFFPQAWQAPMLWIIYIIGIALAVFMARLLRTTIFKGEGEIFVMELPPYRMPTLKGVLMHMWQNAWLYVKKAGTVILAISIFLWALSTFPRTPAEELEDLSPEEQSAVELSNTVSGKIGHAMEPVLKTMGFDYRIGTALIGAMAAKEVFVAQLGVIYSVGEDSAVSLRERLRSNYTPLTGFCIMLFTLISMPCIATIVATRKESGSWGWALLQLGGLTLLAYIVTTATYQVGSLLGIGV